ncbi:hypothetical protein A0H81_02349 [Grifola frondosa]|uniref:Uncharacterized protein n=1 Tax=Grifola frondosa TaxID=5627 RepID=A0A1C7MMK3_GRIFR|nr:hypothetical protein A0H81_02349 [Grifola frondosa]
MGSPYFLIRKVEGSRIHKNVLEIARTSNHNLFNVGEMEASPNHTNSYGGGLVVGFRALFQYYFGDSPRDSNGHAIRGDISSDFWVMMRGIA